MKEKHNNIINGGSLKGTLFLSLALVAIVAIKILIINQM